MNTIKILNIVGARPNFMKIAPIMRAFHNSPVFEPKLVHTGQHYDPALSDQFFLDLDLGKPDFFLEVGSASHAVQTARIMTEFEKVLLIEKPSAVLVVGDVNSTVACSLVAAKEGYPVIHVEAGLRSFDWTMPEEINRVVTDQLSHYLFTTSEEAEGHLEKEGVRGKIYYCGNVMIDSLFHHLEKSSIVASHFPHLHQQKYSLLTLHRPGNVDDKTVFRGLIEFLLEESLRHPIIFPVHPRTRKQIELFGFESCFTPYKVDAGCEPGKIYTLPPSGYLEMLWLMSNANAVYTDSGGIQEETTALGVPCLTLRENTERPVTITQGSNILGGIRKNSLQKALPAFHALFDKRESLMRPPLWDGHAAERIIAYLEKALLSS